ncbi:hypothetical protein D8S78_21750 [Natrialba swarupiae]|nr:hypothetical protein [Natrialba swarupiae]
MRPRSPRCRFRPPGPRSFPHPGRPTRGRRCRRPRGVRHVESTEVEDVGRGRQLLCVDHGRLAGFDVRRREFDLFGSLDVASLVGTSDHVHLLALDQFDLGW